MKWQVTGYAGNNGGNNVHLLPKGSHSGDAEIGDKLGRRSVSNT